MARGDDSEGTKSRWTPERVVAAIVLAGVTAFVLWQVRIDLLLRNTTPALSDLGAHLHEPKWLRHHSLPQGRITGWSPDWFAGYPSYSFYFPLGGLVAALLSFLLPYNIAFKLVAASGAVALPLCAYAFGRLFDRDRLTSACLAVGTLPLLLQPKLLDAGGAISSTAYGEWSYELGFAAAILTLGFVGRGLRTGSGRHRAVAGLLLGATVLLHIVPALMAVIGIATLTLLHWSRAGLRWAAPVLVTAAAVTGFWSVPWFLHLRYTAGAPFPKAVPLPDYLIPTSMAPVLVLGIAGAVVAVIDFARRRQVFGLFVLAMAVTFAAVFSFMPASRVWNARFLAFWYVYLGMLAGLGLVALGRAIDDARRILAEGRPLDNPVRSQLIVPVVALLLVVPAWDTPLSRGALTHGSPDIPGAVELLYGGYERDPDHRSFQSFIDMMRKVGREHGCGRAHWEWDRSAWSAKRSTLMQLIPYWTDGCVAGMQGLFIESAATSPYVRMTNRHLSSAPVRLVAKDEPEKFDVAAGVSDLKALGVRYFVATSPDSQKAADADPGLALLDETEPDAEHRQWKVYEVADVRLVEGLPAAPVVHKGLDSKEAWERASFAWWRGRDRSVPIAATGPSSWRGSSSSFPAVEVSRVRLGDDTVRFHVDRAGVPVLVRVSYFPNWKTSGARGPYRVTPNFMVVVPTAKDVTLRYGRTPVDWLGWLVTLAGVVGVVVLWRSAAVAMPEPVVIEEPKPKRAAPPRKKPKKRR